VIAPFVAVDQLRSMLDSDVEVVVCDVRSRMSGSDPAASFAEGHHPGAVLVDLDTVLSDPPDGVRGRHPLPTPERFADELGRLGIGVGVTVVAYDDRGGAFAGRLVWMLRAIGQPAALLDGGSNAWRDEGGAWTADLAAARPTAVRAVVDWPTGALVDADAVAAHVDAGGVVIDSREAIRYRGDSEPIDPVAGHVPGAINRFFGDHLDGGHLDTVRAAAELATIADDPEAIVYCGSGVTACHNALAAEAVGLGRPRVYVGSWSGWSADPDRAISTGDS
jgi:thiosulfate/3-mercaptopyruvate sulfurtransferase